jgi:hypothetical protein
MVHPPRPSRRTSALLLAATCMVAGCGPVSSRQKVSIDTIQSSILFGLPSPRPATPVSSVPPSASSQPALTAPAITPLDLPPEALFNFPSLPALPSGPCRSASVTAAPEKPATDTIDGLPSAGTYKWKQSGSVKVGQKAYPLTGLQTRYTRGVTQVSNSLNPKDGQPNRVFTYETVEPYKPDGTRLVIDWQVKTDAVQQAGTVSEQGIDVISGAVGDPEAGLAIKEMDLYDAGGKLLTQFAPATGLVMVLLPLTPKQTWTSESVDAKHQTTMVLNGGIGSSRLAIDACGDLVAGWPVVAQISITGVSNGQQYKESETEAYLFAPQYGATLVYRQLKGDTPFGSPDAAYTLGQLHPDPLPAGGH